MDKDPFRSTYRQLSDAEKAKLERIKQKATALHQELFADNPPEDGRAHALARTKLEECVMWAVKAVTAPVQS